MNLSELNYIQLNLCIRFKPANAVRLFKCTFNLSWYFVLHFVISSLTEGILSLDGSSGLKSTIAHSRLFDNLRLESLKSLVSVWIYTIKISLLQTDMIFSRYILLIFSLTFFIFVHVFFLYAFSIKLHSEILSIFCFCGQLYLL